MGFFVDSEKIYSVGDCIRTNESALNVIDYLLCIDKDGYEYQRIPRNTKEDHSYMFEFDEPGEYTLYLASSNAYGYVESQKYTITVNADITPGTETTVTRTRMAYNYVLIDYLSFHIKLRKNIPRGLLIVGIYDKYGRLLHTETEKFDTILDNRDTISFLIPEIVGIVGATNAKVMIWDNLNNMKPLCKSEIIPSLP